MVSAKIHEKYPLEKMLSNRKRENGHLVRATKPNVFVAKTRVLGKEMQILCAASFEIEGFVRKGQYTGR